MRVVGTSSEECEEALHSSWLTPAADAVNKSERATAPPVDWAKIHKFLDGMGRRFRVAGPSSIDAYALSDVLDQLVGVHYPYPGVGEPLCSSVLSKLCLLLNVTSFTHSSMVASGLVDVHSTMYRMWCSTHAKMAAWICDLLGSHPPQLTEEAVQDICGYTLRILHINMSEFSAPTWLRILALRATIALARIERARIPSAVLLDLISCLNEHMISHDNQNNCINSDNFDASDLNFLFYCVKCLSLLNVRQKCGQELLRGIYSCETWGELKNTLCARLTRTILDTLSKYSDEAISQVRVKVVRYLFQCLDFLMLTLTDLVSSNSPGLRVMFSCRLILRVIKTSFAFIVQRPCKKANGKLTSQSHEIQIHALRVLCFFFSYASGSRSVQWKLQQSNRFNMCIISQILHAIESRRITHVRDCDLNVIMFSDSPRVRLAAAKVLSAMGIFFSRCFLNNHLRYEEDMSLSCANLRSALRCCASRIQSSMLMACSREIYAKNFSSVLQVTILSLIEFSACETIILTESRRDLRGSSCRAILSTLKFLHDIICSANHVFTCHVQSRTFESSCMFSLAQLLSNADESILSLCAEVFEKSLPAQRRKPFLAQGVSLPWADCPLPLVKVLCETGIDSHVLEKVSSLNTAFVGPYRFSQMDAATCLKVIARQGPMAILLVGTSWRTLVDAGCELIYTVGDAVKEDSDGMTSAQWVGVISDLFDASRIVFTSAEWVSSYAGLYYEIASEFLQLSALPSCPAPVRSAAAALPISVSFSGVHSTSIGWKAHTITWDTLLRLASRSMDTRPTLDVNRSESNVRATALQSLGHFATREGVVQLRNFRRARADYLLAPVHSDVIQATCWEGTALQKRSTCCFCSYLVRCVVAGLNDGMLNVRAQAYWALANFFDRNSGLFASARGEFRSAKVTSSLKFSLSFCLSVCSSILEGASRMDKDRVKVSAARALGNLSLTCAQHRAFLVSPQWPARMGSALIAASTSTSAKVQWNCCVALGKLLLNFHDKAGIWRMSVIHCLGDKVSNAANRKVSEHASSALANLKLSADIPISEMVVAFSPILLYESANVYGLDGHLPHLAQDVIGDCICTQAFRNLLDDKFNLFSPTSFDQPTCFPTNSLALVLYTLQCTMDSLHSCELSHVPCAHQSSL